MTDDLSDKAMRLLELIAKRQDKTNQGVVIDNQMAATAGLGYRGSDIYAQVVEALLIQEAIIRDRETSAHGIDNLPGGSGYGMAVRITPYGRTLLRDRSL